MVGLAISIVAFVIVAYAAIWLGAIVLGVIGKFFEYSAEQKTTEAANTSPILGWLAILFFVVMLIMAFAH